MGSVMGMIELSWCGIVSGLLFSLEMTGGGEGVANFEAGLRFVHSSSDGVLCA